MHHIAQPPVWVPRKFEPCYDVKSEWLPPHLPKARPASSELAGLSSPLTWIARHLQHLCHRVVGRHRHVQGVAPGRESGGAGEGWGAWGGWPHGQPEGGRFHQRDWNPGRQREEPGEGGQVDAQRLKARRELLFCGAKSHFGRGVGGQAVALKHLEKCT